MTSTSATRRQLYGSFDTAPFRWAIAAIYALAVGLAVLHHEPWADEAQAWLIAKNLPFWQMLTGRQMHYEGSPALWHSLLWVLSHSGLPYASMSWAAWTAAVAGCWFFLKYAPFPLLLRALVPFTFYLSYQFAVVARNYVLMPLLLFGAIHLIRTRSTRATLFSFVIGLLANSSAFGCFLSMALLVVYLWLMRKETPSPAFRGLAVKSAVPYIILVAAAIAVAAPARDWKFVPSPLGDFVKRHRSGKIQATGAGSKQDGAEVSQTGVAEPPIPHYTPNLTINHQLKKYTMPLSHSIWLGALFLVVLVWQLRTHRITIALVPLIFLVLSFELIYKAPRQMGLFFLSVLIAMWLAWPDRRIPLSRYRAADFVCGGLFVLICLPQIAWAERAIRFDWNENYSGSKACANFLKVKAKGKTVFGYDYFTVAINPYLDQPIFRNQPAPYWSWSINNRTDLTMDRILKERPDYVVVAWNQDAQTGVLISTPNSPYVQDMRDYVRAARYQLVATFSGSQVMRSSFSEKDFFEVYRRPDLSDQQWQELQQTLPVPVVARW